MMHFCVWQLATGKAQSNNKEVFLRAFWGASLNTSSNTVRLRQSGGIPEQVALRSLDSAKMSDLKHINDAQSLPIII